MLSKKLMLIILFLMCILSPCLAAAGDYTISPTGANNDQNIINEAIKAASESGGGTVYLNVGVYLVDGTVIIKSNVKLTGDPNAIIKVSSISSQWFTGSTGVISCQESLQNVEICGFQIDGNIDELPKIYSDSRADTAHDCEKLILLGGYSNQFANNISIHDMKLYDSFSDGIYLRFVNYASCYNNIISNCQHEGIYLSVAIKSVIYGNKIAGITSDCARLDNCVDCKVFDNLCFSYDGDSSGAYKHGENGLQIGDAGASQGYDGRNKPTHTTNIEVYNNTFADPGLRAIWLDAAGQKESNNIYIHDNRFIDASGLETMGIPVGDISYDNPPKVEMSEKVFRSIFDILNVSFRDTGRTGQKAEDIPFSVQQTEQGAIAGGIKIMGFKDLINIEGVPYIPDNESILYKAAAVRAPSFNWWDMGASNISQKVTTKIENRIAYSQLTVKMEYYTISTNKITGKTKKNTHISTAFFNDSCPAPEVLRRPAEAKAIITYYNNSVNPHTLVYVPSQGLIKVNYEYSGNSSEHVLMIGEKGTGENGIQYTNFSACDYWRGAIPYQGEALYIPGSVDQSKLNVTCFTPYESFKVTKFDYTEKAWKGESFSDWILPFVLKLGVILFFLWRLLKIPLS